MISLIKKENKGFFKKDGEVIDICFNGNSNIEKGDVLPSDSQIDIKTITYV